MHDLSRRDLIVGAIVVSQVPAIAPAALAHPFLGLHAGTIEAIQHTQRLTYRGGFAVTSIEHASKLCLACFAAIPVHYDSRMALSASVGIQANFIAARTRRGGDTIVLAHPKAMALLSPRLGTSTVAYGWRREGEWLRLIVWSSPTMPCDRLYVVNKGDETDAVAYVGRRRDGSLYMSYHEPRNRFWQPFDDYVGVVGL